MPEIVVILAAGGIGAVLGFVAGFEFSGSIWLKVIQRMGGRWADTEPSS